MELAWSNGRWIKTDEYLIPISNRSFRYGDGLFESFKIVDRKWIFEDEHWRRLKKGAERLQLTFAGNLRADIKSAILALPENLKNAFGRLTVFRSGKGKYTPETNVIDWVLEAYSSMDIFYPNPPNDITIDISEKVILHPHFLSNFKTTSALPYVLASLEKKERRLDDLLLLGPGRNIVEATSSNVFVVKKNRMITPPLSQGCLAGVIRSKLISLVNKSQDYEVFEIPITLAELEDADEIWLTNSGNGIRWVKQFRNLTFGNHLANLFQRKLNESVRSELQKDK